MSLAWLFSGGKSLKYSWGDCLADRFLRGTRGRSHVVRPSARPFLTPCCLRLQTSRTTFSETRRLRCFSPSVWRSP